MHIDCCFSILPESLMIRRWMRWKLESKSIYVFHSPKGKRVQRSYSGTWPLSRRRFWPNGRAHIRLQPSSDPGCAQPLPRLVEAFYHIVDPEAVLGCLEP